MDFIKSSWSQRGTAKIKLDVHEVDRRGGGGKKGGNVGEGLSPERNGQGGRKDGGNERGNSRPATLGRLGSQQREQEMSIQTPDKGGGGGKAKGKKKLPRPPQVKS